MRDKATLKSGTSGYYVEVPGGLLTIAGNFYRIDTEGINRLVPGLLEKHDLKDLLMEADAQQQAFLFWAYYAFLIGLFWGVGVAAILLVVMGALSFLLRPTFAANAMGTIQVALVNESVSYVATAVVLMWFGFNETMPQMWFGLGVFIVLRFILLYAKGGKKDAFPSKNDRIFHFLLQKHAMRMGISTTAIDEIQHNLISYLNTAKRPASGKKKTP